MRGIVCCGALALAACAEAPQPPAALFPEAPAAPAGESGSPARLLGPTAEAHHVQHPTVVREAGPDPAEVAPDPPPAPPDWTEAHGARGERIRELESGRQAYLAVPVLDRTPHATDVYYLGLLELGQNLIAAAADSKRDAPYALGRAQHLLEDLALDAGEETDYGFRAFQLLADLHRARGNEEDATAYEEEIDRVLEATPPDPAPPPWH